MRELVPVTSPRSRGEFPSNIKRPDSSSRIYSSFSERYFWRGSGGSLFLSEISRKIEGFKDISANIVPTTKQSCCGTISSTFPTYCGFWPANSNFRQPLHKVGPSSRSHTPELLGRIGNRRSQSGESLEIKVRKLIRIELVFHQKSIIQRFVRSAKSCQHGFFRRPNM